MYTDNLTCACGSVSTFPINKLVRRPGRKLNGISPGQAYSPEQSLGERCWVTHKESN